MLEVKRIINGIFSSNTYLLFDSDYNYCWLIDIGDYARVADVLPSGVVVRGLFLTHAHFDHTYGINPLHNAHPTCRVFTSQYGKDALYDAKKNFSKYHNKPFVYEGEDVVVVDDEGSMELYPGTKIIFFYTPGHCPSCLTFMVGDWIFTGDSYIPGVKVVTKLPGGDRTLAKKSMERIIKLASGKAICPGHGIMVEQCEPDHFIQELYCSNGNGPYSIV